MYTLHVSDSENSVAKIDLALYEQERVFDYVVEVVPFL